MPLCFCTCQSSIWNTLPPLLPSRMFLLYAPRALGTYFSVLSITSQCNYLYTRFSPILDYEFLNGKVQFLSIFNNPQPPCPAWRLVKQDLKWYVHACLWVLNVSVWKTKILILSTRESQVDLSVGVFSYKSIIVSWILSFYLLTNSSHTLVSESPRELFETQIAESHLQSLSFNRWELAFLMISRWCYYDTTLGTIGLYHMVLLWLFGTFF